MANVSYRLEDLKKAIVGIGYVGENDHMHVLIDCKEVFDEYPDAVATMAIVPPVGESYPKVVNRNGDVVEWLVKNSDVAAEGDGEFQITFTEGEVIKKSVNGRFRVIRSISGSGNAPSGYEDWETDANEKLAAVEEATQKAEDAAEHQPRINASGYWEIWDAETGAYVATSTKAQGDKGDPGDPGTPGDPTELIDDTAGSGTTGKTWSADKIQGVTSQLSTDITEINKEVFDVSGEQRAITIPMNVHGWSEKQKYTMVKGHLYNIEIVSGYDIENYNLLLRLYDMDNNAHLIATMTESQIVLESIYSGEYIAIGSLYNPNANVIIRLTDVTLSSLKNEVNSIESNTTALNTTVGNIDEIIDNNIYRTDDLVFGKNAGWLEKEYSLKNGCTYQITMHNIAFPCLAYIRFYETQNGLYVQKDITTEQSASFEFVPAHNVKYIKVGLASAISDNVHLKIQCNILKENYVKINDTTYPSTIINDVEINRDDGYNLQSCRGLYEHPFEMSWGGEYLASYYNKINGRNNILIALDGDSITAEGYRNICIDNIFKSGGYYKQKSDGTIEMLYSLFNNGKGAASTVEWVGTGESYDFNGRTIPANGMLSESMAENPDLLIIAFGTNDAILNINSTTIEDRINGLAERMEEGLKRIRGTSPVNGREAYGKDVNNLAVIVCVPPGATTASRAIKDWHIYVQKIYSNLARKYKCAFVDFSIPTFDVASYNSLNKWGDIGISDPSVHPNQAFTKYYASVLQYLIYPFGYWNCKMLDNILKSGTTSNRPSKKDVYVGYSYYCTDTHKPIFCSTKGTKAKCTFTVGAMSSDITQYSTGGIRLYIGNVSINMMIINTVYIYAKEAGENTINEYMAKYLCESLNARGYHSECSGATFTLENDECGSVESYGFTDNVNYGATNIPITCALTSNGTENGWMDVNGNAVT